MQREWENNKEIHGSARDLGLRADLKVSKWRDPGKNWFRCGKCDEMQPDDSWHVWVRRNGSVSAWCVACAKRLRRR